MARYRLAVEVDDDRELFDVAESATQLLGEPDRWLRLTVERVADKWETEG